ncbi:hypothetical protein HS1genome_2069 [Sulfodiicoccus acidiphilus]|uniref:Peptidase M20 dimerisation domain-containing protein n=1 Tax=Sulfodiicoccus acidiphilus TaxID=1670455 RepID=A0A348B678_9CREN|nr:hypothetical protein [Sulfodiicoccus acidiphilus]BBD73680.1 hypothetical protein HS1genome_2069 [Sulfodiicoccus acidiphilus]GGU05946.1 hypothetical protein GCM10007116_22730 [Sulfodiicoccus acidiphilus]
MVYVQLGLETEERDLHSSSAPVTSNTTWELVKVLNKLVDDGGREKVPGFYNDLVQLS